MSIPIQNAPLGASVRVPGTKLQGTLVRLTPGSAVVETSKLRRREFDSLTGHQAFEYMERDLVTWSLETPVEVVHASV